MKPIAKVLFSAVLTALSAWAFARTDDAAVANRKWVRRAIADAIGANYYDTEIVTNSDGSVTYTSPFSCEELTNVVAISITVSPSTNDAVYLIDSAIPAMSNDYYYALSGSYYSDVSNTYISTIYAPAVTDYAVITNYYTGEEADTNAFWLSTNYFQRTAYSATAADGTAFTSFKSNEVYWLVAQTNADWKVKILRTRISDELRSRLIGTPLASTGRRFSVFDLLFPSAYADGGQTIGDDGSITWSFHLSSITLQLDNGDVTSLDVSDLTFTYNGGSLPQKPSSTHTCNYGSDCYCKNKNTTLATASESDDYALSTYASLIGDSQEMSSWITDRQWLDAGGKITHKTSGTKYSIPFVYNGITYSLNAKELTSSDSFNSNVESFQLEIARYLKQCQEAYKKSQVCTGDKQQHHEIAYCGESKICKRNSSHLNSHQWNVSATSYDSGGHILKCVCGAKQKREGHTSPGGTITYIYSGGYITGWTRGGVSCTKCPYTADGITHTCIHNYCHTCEGGNGCTLPCQHCFGEHNFTATVGGCKICSCPECGAHAMSTSRTSGSPTANYTNHGGWDWCTAHPQTLEEDGNEKGHGRHCLCKCGYNGCTTTFGFWDTFYNLWMGNRGAESFHNRTDLSPAQYEQIANDDIQHWKKDKSECTRCGDPFGVKENHTSWGNEETPHYKWLSNEKCALRKKCEDCGYLKYQSTEEAGSHVDSGSGSYYTCTSSSDPICLKNMVCSQCIQIFTEEKTHVVSRTSANRCKCGNCKVYQFEHVYNKISDCGNKCCECGTIDPACDPVHKGWKDCGNGTHVCACGESKKYHTYGDWELLESGETTDTYIRQCKLCPATETKTVPKGVKPAACSLAEHIPLPSDCGCECGFYTPGAEVTLTNSGRSIGIASDDESFHKWTSDEECLCKCGTKHHFKEWTSAAKNARTYNASSFCSVCAKCKRYTRSGAISSESDHVTMDMAIDGSKCGCKCGYYYPNGPIERIPTSYRLHPQKPGTCRCYGVGGTGGYWQYYFAARSGCDKICNCSEEKPGHLRWSNSAEPRYVGPNLMTADVTDHTKKSSNCGCKCDWYPASEAPKELHVDKTNGCGCICGKYTLPHNKATGECRCYCYISSDGTKGVHDKQNIGFCTRLCHGPCGEATSEDPSYLLRHTPGTVTCGCECGEVIQSLFDSSLELYGKFHAITNPTKACFCMGEHFHRWGVPDTNCVNYCTVCDGNAKDGKNIGSAVNHTYNHGKEVCGCACGRCLNNTHYYSNTNCQCYGTTQRRQSHTPLELNHDWKTTKIVREDNGTCPKCHVAGSKCYTYYECRRCKTPRGPVVSYSECMCKEDVGSEYCGCVPADCQCDSCKAGTGQCEHCGKLCLPACRETIEKYNSKTEESTDGSTDGADDPLEIK